MQQHDVKVFFGKPVNLLTLTEGSPMDALRDVTLDEATAVATTPRRVEFLVGTGSGRSMVTVWTETGKVDYEGQYEGWLNFHFNRWDSNLRTVCPDGKM